MNSIELIAVSRSKGQSAVNRLAYLAKAKFFDERCGRTRNHERSGALIKSGVAAPANAPSWAWEPESLGNAIERFTNRVNASLMKELRVNIPIELPVAAKIEIVDEFAIELSSRYRTAVHWFLHPHRRSRGKGRGHGHLAFPTRRLDAHGFTGRVTELEFNRDEVKWMRRRWNQLCDAALRKEFGVRPPVTERSRSPSVEREPHLGRPLAAMEERGIRTRVGDEIRGIRRRRKHVAVFTRLLQVVEARIAALRDFIAHGRFLHALRADRSSSHTSSPEGSRPIVPRATRTRSPVAHHAAPPLPPSRLSSPQSDAKTTPPVRWRIPISRDLDEVEACAVAKSLSRDLGVRLAANVKWDLERIGDDLAGYPKGNVLFQVVPLDGGRQAPSAADWQWLEDQWTQRCDVVRRNRPREPQLRGRSPSTPPASAGVTAKWSVVVPASLNDRAQSLSALMARALAVHLHSDVATTVARRGRTAVITWSWKWSEASGDRPVLDQWIRLKWGQLCETAQNGLALESIASRNGTHGRSPEVPLEDTSSPNVDVDSDGGTEPPGGRGSRLR
jgi:hypothetical protein